MSIDWGSVPLGSVLPFPFSSHDAATGANEAASALAVGDILCYKGTSMTQRSSTSGYALMDTDGLDIDSLTGVNGVSIDTSDNTDAGFFVAGSFYWVILGPITIDAQTVYTVLGTFRLTAAEGVAGVPDVNVTHVGDTAQTAGDLKASLNTIDDFLDTEVAAIQADTDNIQTRLPAALVNGRMSSELMGTGTGVISDTSFFAGAINAAALATDAVTEIQSGLATAAALTTVDDFLDTEIADIQARLPAALVGGRMDSSVGAVASAAITAASIAADAIGASELAADAATEIADAVLARALTEGYSADGAAPTLQQALMMVLQMLTEFAISGTTLTVRRLDGTTTAMTFTLNDATNPSSITRAT